MRGRCRGAGGRSETVSAGPLRRLLNPWLVLGSGLSFSAGLLIGCASPAPPRAPSLHLPEKATRLEAQRVGDAVQLSWLSPTKTTDGEAIREPITAAICRESDSPGAKVRGGAPPCATVQRMTDVRGPSTVSEVLPEQLRRGGATLLGYRVELLNAAGRSAGTSDAVYVAGGEAPPAVGPLTLTPQREAVLLRWSAQGSAAAMQVTRTLIASAAGPVLRSAQKETERRGQQGKLAGALKSQGLAGFGAQRAEDGSVMLTDAAPDRDHHDAGGMVDRSVRDADTYLYVAQRVQWVTLAGHSLELRGVASPAARVEYHDSFPPAAPSGLVSVPGGSFGGQPEIDLSWDAGAEDNLVGYYVYRRAEEPAASGFVRLTEEPVTIPAYRDRTVETGRAYRYRVTALDRLRHEGPPSVEVRESVRK